MTEALLVVSIGSIFAVCGATLIVAARTLQEARRYVELAEARMEHLREGQALLLTSLREERQRLKEEREQRQETWQEREEREAAQRVERLRDELLQPRTVRRGGAFEGPGSSSFSVGTFEDVRGLRERLEEGPPRPAAFPEPEQPAKTAPEDEKPRVAVWHPHPDDDVSPGEAGQAPFQGDGPVKMFRKHYDKYLENYEGYVKLVERIYETEAVPGSLAERQREERLRRANDGIKRTTARLDILEEYNPELATDDRISRRASIAHAHSELERSRLNRS
jgi:hypothetical protein